MTTNQPKALRLWHQVMQAGDVHLLQELLAEEVVFHSPVVHTPQRGKKITTAYLAAAEMVLGGEKFTYTREVVGDGFFILEFTTELDGIFINGVDIVEYNDQDQIVSFKVMVRPLKAIQIVHQKMGEMLMQMKKSS